ncbi:Lipase [Trema orientale]|uniref:Lipase n=1 Tax=Trema orientale TaxID=63057 RepID=A0A2P5EV00_TREOI|nr:Lipase [Trema orientale]
MKFLSLFSFPTPLCKVFFTVIIIVIFVVYNGGATANKLPLNETVPAVFVFGDSIVDPGNNNHVKTIVKCDFPPYGRDFIGGMPTGRFSNGRVPSDIIAEIFNVKKLLPAYLDPNLQLQDLLTGVSFASGGAGYDPLTAEVVACLSSLSSTLVFNTLITFDCSVLSLSDQLEMFKDVIGKIKATVGENRTEMIVSKSIFIVCIGSDDIANTYYTTPLRRPHYDIPAYTDLMAKSASSFLQDLYGQGARRIGVVSLPPIGCVPSQRTLSGDIARGCQEQANQAARLFNSKLSFLMSSLNKRFPEARLVYFDIYNPLLSLIQNPANYGNNYHPY